MSRIRTPVVKISLALLFEIVAAFGARADVNGDVTSIKSSLSPHAPFTAAGEVIDFKVSLDGTFALTNTFGTATLAQLPEIRMVVNGTVAYATLCDLTQQLLGGVYQRTVATFRYVIKPGDMAQPLKIYATPPIPYELMMHQWEIRNVTTTSNAVWRFNLALSHPELGEVYDIDLAKANLVIRTLSFDDGDSETWIPAKESGHDWRVTTVVPPTSAVVDFYVWTPNTNVLQIGSTANQTWLLLNMPTNTAYAEFPIRGLAVGTADVYLQRPQDYYNNSTVGVTNYVKRSLTITPPPPPAVQIIFPATGTDSVTLDETNALNIGKFKVELSEAFTNAVTVRVDLAPSNQTSVTFATTPMTVTIAPNQTLSSEQAFSVPDGNVTSQWGITMSPVITSAAAAAYYTDQRSATVIVQNVRPSVAGRSTSPAVRGVPCTFEWLCDDVEADLASGMKVTWNFNGETVTNVTGASGSLQYTFATTGMKSVSVTATDKDGLASAASMFFKMVDEPPPPPSISVVPAETVYSETTTNNTGSLMVYLSEPYASDVWVQLAATLQGQAQSNIVFATDGAIRIPAGDISSPVIAFSIPDGTPASEIFGIDIVPTVTNAPASGYYTDLRPSMVIVMNVAPVIVYPAASDLSGDPLYSVTQGQPGIFNWSVSDVPADLSTINCTWYFGDGTSQTVTGSSGGVSHTFTASGERIVRMIARDKDGGSSEVAFKIRVVKADGFAEWAAARGLSGDPYVLFELDRDGDGVANGFEYAFGDNRTNGVPLMTVRFVEGVPVVETPTRDPTSALDAFVTVEACTNLPSGQWTLPMGPYTHAAKPSDRDWYAPLTTVPKDTFFRLRAVLD